MWEEYQGPKRVIPTTTSDSRPFVFMPLCNSFSLSVDRTCGLLQTKGTWQRWWDVTSTAVLYYMAKTMGGASHGDGT